MDTVKKQQINRDKSVVRGGMTKVRYRQCVVQSKIMVS